MLLDYISLNILDDKQIQLLLAILFLIHNKSVALTYVIICIHISVNIYFCLSSCLFHAIGSLLAFFCLVKN